MTSQELPFFSAPVVLGYWSGHTPPRKIYLVAERPEGFTWGITEDRAKAKVFQGAFAAHNEWLSHHTWPEDYRHCLSDGHVFTEPA